MRPLCLLLLTASSLAAQRPPAPAPTLPRDLDAYVARVMRDFEVPGIGLAVVKDGRVLLARGYGVRTLGDPAPVDERTLFGIASNTKAFTATALGLLVAIPAVWAFNIFTNKVEGFQIEMDNSSSELIDYFIKRRELK